MDDEERQHEGRACAWLPGEDHRDETAGSVHSPHHHLADVRRLRRARVEPDGRGEIGGHGGESPGEGEMHIPVLDDDNVRGRQELSSSPVPGI